MKDNERSLALICESICDDFLKNLKLQDENNKRTDRNIDDPDNRFLISSKPYMRKNNVVNDKSTINCWETHFRFAQFDLYITIMRRSFIPPIMDSF